LAWRANFIVAIPMPGDAMAERKAGDVVGKSGHALGEIEVSALPPTRVRRPKYTIEELVEGYDAAAPLSDDEQAWMDAPAVGREIW
jgi:hypothetical protein